MSRVDNGLAWQDPLINRHKLEAFQHHQREKFASLNCRDDSKDYSIAYYANRLIAEFSKYCKLTETNERLICSAMSQIIFFCTCQLPHSETTEYDRGTGRQRYIQAPHLK